MKTKRIIFLVALLATVIFFGRENLAISGSAEISKLMGGAGLSAQAATIIDAQYSSAVTASTVPSVTNTVDLGSSSKAYRAVYAVGLVAPTTAEEAVAGAGTGVSDAAALSATKHIHQLTGANGTVGWKFSTGVNVGSIEILLNTTAGVPKIYGEAGSTCNGGATDAACTLVTGIVAHICYKTAALTYICA